MAFFVVREIKKNNRKKPLAIVIGRAVSKKAVLRNKIKRRIRAISREIFKNSRKAYVVIAKPEVADLSYEDLKKEIIKTFKKHDSLIS